MSYKIRLIKESRTHVHAHEAFPKETKSPFFCHRIVTESYLCHRIVRKHQKTVIFCHRIVIKKKNT